MKRLIVLLALLLLPGCAMLAGNTMSAEQLAAAAKDKNASAYCVQVPTPWGLAFTLYSNTDKATIVSGSTTVKCGAAEVTFTDVGKQSVVRP